MLEDPYREGDTVVRGRTIAFAEYGDFEGIPVVAWPGNPGSRFGFGWARMWARHFGVRLLLADRPGMGRSDPDSKRTVASTARDICEIAASIGYETFAVIGNSSGGPYALACAAIAPDRVRRVAIVDGVGHMQGSGAHVGMSESNDEFWRRAPLAPDATADVFERILREAPTRDIHPERKLDIQEAGRQGAALLAFDAYVITQDWDFRLQDIVAPVDLWHGALDDDIPFVQAQRLADQIEKVTLHVWPRSHHHMPPEAMPDVYSCLLSPRP